MEDYGDCKAGGKFRYHLKHGSMRILSNIADTFLLHYGNYYDRIMSNIGKVECYLLKANYKLL